MEDAGSSARVKEKPTKSRRPLWIRFVHRVLRQARKRKSEKHPEPVSDRAARRTAWATIAIACLTLVLAVVNYFQWREIHAGSTDTHNLAVAAGKQATWTQHLATNMQTQADRTKDLADRMKEQADETRTIAAQAVKQTNEARVSANAARSAAETASEALHVSERAYLILGVPTDDFQHKRTNIPIINSGHIPSGIATIVIHEATFRLDSHSENTLRFDAVVERHWRVAIYQTIPVVPFGSLIAVEVKLPAVNQEQIADGKQGVLIAALATYNDGFPNTPEQTYLFCDASSYTSSTKLFVMRPCDNANAALNVLMALDKYPSPKYQEK